MTGFGGAWVLKVEFSFWGLLVISIYNLNTPDISKKTN